MEEKNLTKEEIIALAGKVSDGLASEPELGLYLQIVSDPETGEKWMSEMGDAQYIEAEMLSKITGSLSVKKKIYSSWVLRAAAVFVAALLLSAGAYIYFSVFTGVESGVQPGSAVATLMLSDGKKIALRDFNALTLSDHGSKISNSLKGILDYHSDNAATGGDLAYNTLFVPRGGTYAVTLSDGTRVWLNSQSSLRYPVAYGKGRRVVELDGEAYFEVFKDQDRPFVVLSRGQSVRVMGTHFNINAYSDERSVRTTLLEGSVQVWANGSSAYLKPLQQSAIVPGIIGEIEIVDVAEPEKDIAWKNGNFYFDNEDLPSIMRKISKWYNVDVQYNGDFSNIKFNGIVSRSKDIKLALAIMEATGDVHFKIERRKITVEP